MKNELRKTLQPFFNNLKDTEKDNQRVLKAQRDCITRNGFNGCWNCPSNNEGCAVNQTRAMIDGRTRLIYRNIVHRVMEWLGDA